MDGTYNWTFAFQKQFSGLTGNIEFNDGKRSNFKVDLLKLKKEEIRKVGQWTLDGGINITDPNAFYENHAPNITLVVMTRKVSGHCFFQLFILPLFYLYVIERTLFISL